METLPPALCHPDSVGEVEIEDLDIPGISRDARLAAPVKASAVAAQHASNNWRCVHARFCHFRRVIESNGTAGSLSVNISRVSSLSLIVIRPAP